MTGVQRPNSLVCSLPVGLPFYPSPPLGKSAEKPTLPTQLTPAMMLQGLRTVILIYHVNDLEKAKAWYRAVLGISPYFDAPFYVGFNVGGFELGLDPDASGVTWGSNAVVYWGVPDIGAAYQRLLSLGARADSPIQEVGEGIRVAKVTDPFGNVVGIIENPHFELQ